VAEALFGGTSISNDEERKLRIVLKSEISIMLEAHSRKSRKWRMRLLACKFCKVGGDYKLDHLTREYHNVLRPQEIFWRQKYRLSWLKEGDANTHFFRRATVCIRARTSSRK